MYRIIILLQFTLLSISALSQVHSINGTISGLDNTNLYLMKLMGERKIIVDTATTNQGGSFTFNMKEDAQPGMYVVLSGPGKAVELIYNNEDIQFVTNGFEQDAGIQIISSVENLIYYDYLSIKGITLYKIDVLNEFLHKYPPNDEFYDQSVVQYNNLKDMLLSRIEELTNNNPNTLAARYIKTDQPVIPNPQYTIEDQNRYLKLHHFDNVDFSDTALINTTFLTSKVVGYLSLNQNDAKSQEELEELMLRSVDTILANASVNQKVYEFLVDFLISGFESIGFEEGLTHIANASTLDQFCENTERKEKLENKLELIKKLAIGQPAPNFTATDIVGNTIELNSINANKTILVFWASWCPHCEDIMPVLKEYYNNSSDIEIIGISIDESKDDLMKSVNELDLNWINIAELKGWNGDIVEEYGIAATPTIFVLDSEKKIIGKPVGEKSIRQALN
jgi:thiol-disulfide isomerase/thioredoxin